MKYSILLISMMSHNAMAGVYRRARIDYDGSASSSISIDSPWGIVTIVLIVAMGLFVWQLIRANRIEIDYDGPSKFEYRGWSQQLQIKESVLAEEVKESERKYGQPARMAKMIEQMNEFRRNRDE